MHVRANQKQDRETGARACHGGLRRGPAGLGGLRPGDEGRIGRRGLSAMRMFGLIFGLKTGNDDSPTVSVAVFGPKPWAGRDPFWSWAHQQLQFVNDTAIATRVSGRKKSHHFRVSSGLM